MSAVIDALRQEFTQEIQRLERRLEARQGAVPETGSSGSRTGRARSQRRYPDVVTREPADDDEEGVRRGLGVG